MGGTALTIFFRDGGDGNAAFLPPFTTASAAELIGVVRALGLRVPWELLALAPPPPLTDPPTTAVAATAVAADNVDGDGRTWQRRQQQRRWGSSRHTARQPHEART